MLKKSDTRMIGDWSPIATFSNINSFWEFFQRNLLSLIHRFIPFHLQLSYPSSHPWFTGACGEAVVLKQLAFASWKANPTEGNLSSFHKAQNKCVSTLRRARKQHLSNLKSELSNLSPSAKSWWRLVMSVSGACSPSSLLVCPKPITFCTNLTQSHPAVLGLCLFLLTRWRFCCQTSTQILQPVQMASAHVS